MVLGSMLTYPSEELVLKVELDIFALLLNHFEDLWMRSDNLQCY